MTHNKRNIIEYFGEISDYRRTTPNKKHELVDILVIALCGMLSGADDWVSIEHYGKTKRNWFQKFLSLANGIPSHDTFNRVFSRIDPEQFTDCFLSWIKDVCPIMEKETVAIDGKTLRRSHDKGHSKAAIHMVSAWACERHLVLGQIKTAEKSNEITAIPELIESLISEGCLFSIDAMGCQKTIVNTVLRGGGDYLIAVKGNQPSLESAIKATFEGKDRKTYLRPQIDFDEVSEINRDRHEIRRCWVTNSLSKLAMLDEWDGLTTIAKIESERTLNGKTSVESRYYICSCHASAEAVNRAVRCHWSVENSLHWVLDMAFREDECRVRKRNGAENLARLRHIALNLLKQDKSLKLGVKNKRLKAGWDNDYLLHLINDCL